MSSESALDRPKAVLFCPDCGHESPPDGDWSHASAGDTRRVVCPDCSTTVTRRRRQVGRLLTPVTPLLASTDFAVGAWRRYNEYLDVWLP